MWEHLYPGCYSFISALWEKRQHPYLLQLIWKRHTWGLSTRSECIWWQVKGSLQDSGWLSFFKRGLFFFFFFGQMFKALPASAAAALMHFHRNVSALMSLRAVFFSESANTNMQAFALQALQDCKTIFRVCCIYMWYKQGLFDLCSPLCSGWSGLGPGRDVSTKTVRKFSFLGFYPFIPECICQ